eukprot:TRINITY_DN100682_c0_g1_i1.p1 TRINITY_DN100682_c0_g1~~TRINITY_DN100682_c0_g1_i1.p1  ORF type:complete len:511 (-),score=183.37 TRINITY_DN100682_c0_g1_i1:115-1647(-)
MEASQAAPGNHGSRGDENGHCRRNAVIQGQCCRRSWAPRWLSLALVAASSQGLRVDDDVVPDVAVPVPVGKVILHSSSAAASEDLQERRPFSSSREVHIRVPFSAEHAEQALVPQGTEEPADEFQHLRGLVDGLGPASGGEELLAVREQLKRALDAVIAAKKSDEALQRQAAAWKRKAEETAATLAKVTSAKASIDAKTQSVEEAEEKEEAKTKCAQKAKVVAEEITAKAEEDARNWRAERDVAVEKEKVAAERLVPYKKAEDKAEKYAALFQGKMRAAMDDAEQAKIEMRNMRKEHGEAIAKHETLLKEVQQAKQGEKKALERARQAEQRLKESQSLKLDLATVQQKLKRTEQNLERCYGDLNQQGRTSADFKHQLLVTKDKVQNAEKARAEAEKHEVQLVTDAGRLDNFRHQAEQELSVCRDEQHELRAERDDARSELLDVKKAQLRAERDLADAQGTSTRLALQVKQAQRAGCLLRAKGEACNQFHQGRDCASADCQCDGNLRCTCA